MVGDEVLLLGTQCSAYCRFYFEAVFSLRGVVAATRPPPLPTHVFIYMYIQNITNSLSPEEKELEREVDHSPSSSDKLR